MDDVEVDGSVGADAAGAAVACDYVGVLASQGAWTPERREAQRQRALITRPWLCSTGPRTAEGKARSALRGLKHIARSKAHAETRRCLKAISQEMRNLRKS